MKFVPIALGLAAIFSCHSLSSLPANAQGLDIEIGKHGIRPVIRDDAPRDGCEPGEAISAAREEGFHHPRIVRATDRRIVVEGMTESGMDRISFANVPGCPQR
ncbi:hypothetical protein [Rhizobium tubonense]|uniref:Antifreeze protein n=1 Tax=Rhizobium tubonense TaxID=484088 RepID=A0A2W4EML7_9HYPH|nr:hypothetical protein [Rhizobium tubonense]PZM14926.1 hypothetical protein CPY51_09580 [Rhizobium tubonense]